MTRNDKLTGNILALLAMFSYSTSPTMTRLGYEAGFGTFTLMFSRFFISLILLAPTTLRHEKNIKLGKNQWLGLLVVACLSIAGNFTFNYAYRNLPSVVGTAVSLVYILIVFIFEILLGREKLTGVRLLIISMTVISIVMVSLPNNGETINMTAFIVGLIGSVFFASQVTFANSKVMKDVSSNIIVLATLIPIVVITFISALASGEPLFPQTGMQWVSILTLSIVGVLGARVLFFRASRMIGATKASIIDAFEPFSSGILGLLILGQSLSVHMVAGSILMTTSIVLLLREKESSS